MLEGGQVLPLYDEPVVERGVVGRHEGLQCCAPLLILLVDHLGRTAGIALHKKPEII